MKIFLPVLMMVMVGSADAATRNFIPRGTGEGYIGLSTRPWAGVYADQFFGDGAQLSNVVSTGTAFGGDVSGTYDDITIVSVPTSAVDLSTVTANHVLKAGDTMTGDLSLTGLTATYGVAAATGVFASTITSPYLQGGGADFTAPVTGISLSEIEDLEGDKTFTMANKTLTWTFTNPTGGMLWNFTGAAAGHSLEINQSGGNPGADTHLLHIQADDTDVGLLHGQSPAVGTRALMLDVTGDTYNRLTAYADGKLDWGSGSAAADTNLYRDSADVLKTDDSLVVAGSVTANTYYGDGTNLTGLATDAELAAVAASTGTIQSSLDAVILSTGTLVSKAGDTMTGPLTLSGSSLTVTGKSALWGDVGVGTNTPKTDSLHLWGKDLRLQTDADSGGAVKFMKNGSDSTVNMLYRGGADFTILKNFTQDYTILQLQSPSGALGTPLESTLALVRGDEPNVEYIDLYNNGYASQTQHGIRIQKRGTGVYRDFVFDQYDGTTYTPLMILKADGKIGVNISTPTSTLDVAGTSASTSTITLSNKTTELFAEDVIGAIDFRTYDSSSDGAKVKGYIRGVAETEYTGGNHRLRLDFGTSRDTNSPSTRMSINGSGNVGIGTISPTALLQVAGGNILISGTGAGIYNTGTSTASAYYGDGSNLTGVIPSTATGNYALRVATATYLATAPGACAAGQYISGLTADGTKTCGTPSGAGDVVLAATQTFTGGNTFVGVSTFTGIVYLSTGGVSSSWIVLPNGLLYQWGYYAGGANSPTITFPRQFKSAVLSITTQIIATGVNGSMIEIYNQNPAGFVANQRRHDAVAITNAFYWMAIGDY